MPQATTSEARQRPDLASFLQLDLAMQRRGFVATKIMPPVEVRSAVGKYRRVKLKSLLANANADTKRTDKGGYNEGRYEYDHVSYQTEEHGWKEPLDDRETNILDDPDLEEQLARDRAWETLLNGLESRVLAIAIDAVETASQNNSAAAVWTNYANSTPIDDVQTACIAVWQRTGVWPNTMAISRRRWKDLRRSAQIIAAVEANGSGESALQGRLGPKLVAEALDLDEIVISDAIKNTANVAQDPSISSMFPDTKAWIGRTTNSRDFRIPSFGRIMHWGGDGSRIDGEDMIGVVERYRDEDVRSDVIRVRHETDEHTQYIEMGQVIDTLAS